MKQVTQQRVSRMKRDKSVGMRTEAAKKGEGTKRLKKEREGESLPFQPNPLGFSSPRDQGNPAFATWMDMRSLCPVK